MLIKLSQLYNLQPLEKVIITSIDISLYQVLLKVGEEEYPIVDDKGEFVRSFNILDLKKLFRPFSYGEMVLRQESAFDEMVGQPDKSSSNRLEVPLFDNHLS